MNKRGGCACFEDFAGEIIVATYHYQKIGPWDDVHAEHRVTLAGSRHSREAATSTQVGSTKGSVGAPMIGIYLHI